MYTEVLKIMHTLATMILLFLAIQMKDLMLKLLLEIQ